MHSKSFEDKREYDLHGKWVKDKRDNILHGSSPKNQNVKGPIFVFEEKDVNDKDTKDLELWTKDDIDRDRNNFVILTYQY